MIIKSVEILNRLVGEGNWITIAGLDYDTIVLQDGVSMPSKSDFDRVKREVEAECNANEYQIQRAPEYPDLADFADAYYWAQEGDNSKMTEYLAKIKDVKNKYPKG
jgi:hypothetical protein